MKHDSNRARQAHKPGHLLIGLLMGVSPWALSAQASAQTQAIAENGQVRIAYDIPAQDLADALTQYARQSDLRVLYPAARLAGRSAPQVRGSYTRAEALQLLMSRSGLSATIAGETIQIQEQRPPQQDRASAEPERVRADDAPAEQAGETTADEEIVVTGTRIRGVQPVGANVQSLDRADIEASGRSTLSDVLQTVPQNFPGSQSELGQQSATDARRNIAFGSSVDLRGLGADATLSLVNGRRLAPAGFGNFVDISVIPLSVVERIEILPDGASATYGADAVGGVVNVLLRRDFEGAETALRYGGADDVSELQASQLFGAHWGTGRIMGAYEYRHRDELRAADRPFTASSDLRPYGGSNFDRASGNPGNIIRIGTTATSRPIPAGQDGTQLTQSQLVVGPLNMQNENEGSFLLPEQDSHSLFGSFEQSLGERLEVFADVLATRREGHSERAQLSANLVVPQSNAYRQLNNLFSGQGNLTVAYWMGDDLGPITTDTLTRSLFAVSGARFDFGADWQAEASVAYARHQDRTDVNNTFDASGAIVAALASSNLSTAFNPFGDGSNTNPSVLQNLTLDSHTDNDSTILSYGLKADGPLFNIWGGSVRAAVGYEQRHEEFSIDRLQTRFSGALPQFIQDPGERTVDAAFGEVYLPLVSPENNVPLIAELTASASVRYERSSDFEEATTPRFGVRWAPFSDLAFRGAWGQSFKAPQFQQMLGGIGGTLATATAAQDPQATNGSTGILSLAGSNPALEPERADVWTTGVHYNPAWADRLVLDAAYFDIDFAGRITTPGSTLAALSNPTGLESVLIRNPTPEQIAAYLALADNVTGSMPIDGIELIYDRRLTNLASLRVRGIDLSASYGFDTSFGDFSVSASASHLLQFESMAVPGAQPIDQLDTIANNVDWRGRLNLSWHGDDWGASASLNYVDDYRDNLSLPNRRIKSWTTIDARITREWENTDGDATVLSFSVQNLFDRDPPFANNPIGYGFDSANASPLGRYLAIEIRRSW